MLLLHPASVLPCLLSVVATICKIPHIYKRTCAILMMLLLLNKAGAFYSDDDGANWTAFVVDMTAPGGEIHDRVPHDYQGKLILY